MNNPTVILVHGLGGIDTGTIAEMFLQKGYNVLTYDQKSSNENTDSSGGLSLALESYLYFSILQFILQCKPKIVY